MWFDHNSNITVAVSITPPCSALTISRPDQSLPRSPLRHSSSGKQRRHPCQMRSIPRQHFNFA
ncbi:hypothetical protein E2C01_014223 [Portunus trituberculatus]|uniref:Uncharacterized protein n=1 Tax=Portunus trituberculatus TaxID=210409 RepID=A0A5B7DJB8_PORTR|nr:hypothetical protein [Portunus trituberculatus]